MIVQAQVECTLKHKRVMTKPGTGRKVAINDGKEIANQEIFLLDGAESRLESFFKAFRKFQQCKTSFCVGP